MRLTELPPGNNGTTEGDDTGNATPSIKRVDPVTLIASACPVLVTVVVIVTVSPLQTGAGATVSGLPTRLAGACRVMQACTLLWMEKPQVVPSTVKVKHAVPLPCAVVLHWNVAEAPGTSVPPPGGTGPMIGNNIPFGVPVTLKESPPTSLVPLFVTVSDRVMTCPTDALMGMLAETAKSPITTASGTENNNGLVTLAPRLISVPTAYVLSRFKPGAVPVTVKENVTEAPPDRVTVNGGVGPSIESPDVPAESKMAVPDTRRTPFAVDPPVFVTVTVTKAVSPMHI